MDGLLQHQQAVFEVRAPESFAKLRQRIAAPNVIDENVEPLVPPLDYADEFFHFRGNSVIHADGDAMPACRSDHLGGLFNRFRPARSWGSLCTTLSRTAPGAIDRRASLAQRDGDAASGATRGASN